MTYFVVLFDGQKSVSTRFDANNIPELLGQISVHPKAKEALAIHIQATPFSPNHQAGGAAS